MHMRAFQDPDDFTAISEFIRTLFEPDNRDGNWLQPVWEYAYTHPWFDRKAVGRIGVWEDRGRIVGAVTYELRLGEAFLHVHRDHSRLKPAMLDHAERWLARNGVDGPGHLQVYVPDFDTELEAEVLSRGYVRDPAADRPISRFAMPSPFPRMAVPPGFTLITLAEDNDLVKWDRVLHRGFNHPGEPPSDGVEGRAHMQAGPNYRKDLAVAVRSDTGDFVSFCGMWHDAANRICLVEPVATDPEYRRLGLGRAAVLEGIRRCAELGATEAYVGSDMPFYLSFGFRKLYVQRCWRRQ